MGPRKARPRNRKSSQKNRLYKKRILPLCSDKTNGTNATIKKKRGKIATMGRNSRNPQNHRNHHRNNHSHNIMHTKPRNCTSLPKRYNRSQHNTEPQQTTRPKNSHSPNRQPKTTPHHKNLKRTHHNA